jgi:hypothetical protein
MKRGDLRLRHTSPQGATIVAQDVSPGLALLGRRSPAGRHTGFDVVGEEVPSLKGLRDLITRSPSTDVLGYDCDALRAED